MLVSTNNMLVDKIENIHVHVVCALQLQIPPSAQQVVIMSNHKIIQLQKDQNKRLKSAPAFTTKNHSPQ